MKKKAKKKNPQDATLRNIRALKKELAKLKEDLSAGKITIRMVLDILQREKIISVDEHKKKIYWRGVVIAS